MKPSTRQKSDATQEIVLPDGRFARLRPILLRDMMAAMVCTGPMENTIDLATRCLTIDDRAVGRDDLMALEYSSWVCISSLIDKQISGAIRTKDGVA